jgi:hypothetical protein
VWVTLQQAADGLGRGENFYAMSWSGSPGIQDAFTYLPWTAVLLAPGRWLFGDIRWALVFWMLVAVGGTWLLARPAPPQRVTAPAVEAQLMSDTRSGRGRGALPVDSLAGSAWVWVAAAVTALLVFAPGTLTQLDQAWTEPLLLAGIVWWAVLVGRGRAWWAVLPLALACASKQHLALLLPILLVWKPFGWQRVVGTGALTGALIAPWFLASPADFVHDTVSLLVSFHPIKFANQSSGLCCAGWHSCCSWQTWSTSRRSTTSSGWSARWSCRRWPWPARCPRGPPTRSGRPRPGDGTDELLGPDAVSGLLPDLADGGVDVGLAGIHSPSDRVPVGRLGKMWVEAVDHEDGAVLLDEQHPHRPSLEPLTHAARPWRSFMPVTAPPGS